MSVVIGVHPGGRSHFATCAMFWNGRLPALVFNSRTYSSVQEVLDNIVGVYGEWTEIDAVAVDAPLSWSTQRSGQRKCDIELRSFLPKWAPNTWTRPPNSLTGASAVQGPALVWAMAREGKTGLLPQTQFFETHARASLARIAGDLKPALIGYRKQDLNRSTRTRHLNKLLDRLLEPGIIKLEVDRPSSPDQLEALTAATVALGSAFPESGLLVREFEGEEIRPVGRRSLHILDALP